MSKDKKGGGGDYEVGYGKPPKHSQFKPRQSGNPSGKPKGTKNLKTDLLEELGELVHLREGDRDMKISKQRALIKSLVARGVKGNDRAAAKIIDLYMRVVGIEDAANEAELPLTSEERDVLENLKARFLRNFGEEGETDGSAAS
jgi:hypothetical protein